jgi:hypothetical protein
MDRPDFGLVGVGRCSGREGCKIWVNATLATAYGHVTVSCRTLVIELAAPPEWAAAMYRA